METNGMTTSYRWFLASWAKLLPWQQVANVFHTSWQSVFRSVRHAVMWGVVHRKWGSIAAIGVDEIAAEFDALWALTKRNRRTDDPIAPRGRWRSSPSARSSSAAPQTGTATRCRCKSVRFHPPR
jgi:hypothetical protein